MVRYNRIPGFVPALLGLLIITPLTVLYAQGSAGGVRILEEGQPPAIVHPTVDDVIRLGDSHASAGHNGGGAASTTSNLSYHGGTADGSAGTVGVETAPKVYLVFWGKQWSSDPSGEAAILQSFLGGVGGSIMPRP
jgi:hypothetical protein